MKCRPYSSIHAAGATAVLLIFATVIHADPRQWDPRGLPVRQGWHIEWTQTTVRNVDGSALVVWSDSRTGDRSIYAQLIGADGAVEWDSGGVLVADDPSQQERPSAAEVTGGWIIMWVDYRNDPPHGEEDRGGDVWA